MRIGALCVVLMLQLGLSLPASAQTNGKLTVVPLDRTHVRLALPERTAQAKARPRTSTSPGPGARGVPVLPPAVNAQ